MYLTILTGDIVDSTSLSAKDLDSVIARLQSAKADIGEAIYPATAAFARREGDGWQIALHHPALGLRAALYLHATLRKAYKTRLTRIAIATGDGDIAGQSDLNRAHGPVFTASGRLLSELDESAPIGHAGGGAVAAATRLAGHIALGWTQAQARAVAAMLLHKRTHADAARALGISRQAVDQALQSAGYPAIRDALEMIEAAT